MQKSPNQNSRRPNQRDYLSSPVVNRLIPKVLCVLTAVLGTACTFALASKPQQPPNAIARIETAVKPPILQPTRLESVTSNLSQGNQQVNNKLTIFPRLRSLGGSSWDYTNTVLAPNRLQAQKRQQTLNNTSWLLTAITRSLQQQNTPTPPPQVPVDLQPALKQAQVAHSKQTQPSTPVISQAQLQQEQPSIPVVETNPKQNQPQSAQQEPAVKLTLSDVVVLALENNRSLKNAYLERIVQREDLAVAESKFDPNFTPVVSISLAQFGSNRATTNGDVGLEAIVKVPTGGQLSFRWAANSQTLSSNSFLLDPDDDGFGQNLRVGFNQPLLRGAGIRVNRASIDIARLTEQINILDLKSILNNTITEAILAYRELLRTQEQLKIAQLSLKSAQDFLEINRFLIEAGRLAPVDIVQSETDVANRQVSLVEAENRLDAARLALLDILDVEQGFALVAVETPTASPINIDSNNLRQLAFKNRPEYVKAQLDLDRTQLALLQAENNRLWDLNLNTSFGFASKNTSDLRVGLGLSRTLGDLTIERDFQRSRINQLQAENLLKQQHNSLEIQVTDSIRNVNLSFTQMELARKATTSSERQLEIAREKQRLGRDITVFELVRLQNDLVQARNVELNATIDYLNALTRLDQALGTTLDTWQVTIERK